MFLESTVYILSDYWNQDKVESVTYNKQLRINDFISLKCLHCKNNITKNIGF